MYMDVRHTNDFFTSVPDYGGDGFVIMGAGINKVAQSLAAEVQIKIEVGLHR